MNSKIFFLDDATNVLTIFPSKTSKPYKGFKSNRQIEFKNDDIIDLDGKENSNSGSETEFESSVDTIKREEIPPVDRMPTVFKGLMGGITSGFGLF